MLSLGLAFEEYIAFVTDNSSHLANGFRACHVPRSEIPSLSRISLKKRQLIGSRAVWLSQVIKSAADKQARTAKNGGGTRPLAPGDSPGQAVRDPERESCLPYLIWSFLRKLPNCPQT